MTHNGLSEENYRLPIFEFKAKVVADRWIAAITPQHSWRIHIQHILDHEY